jgi:hypothetical protein
MMLSDFRTIVPVFISVHCATFIGEFVFRVLPFRFHMPIIRRLHCAPFRERDAGGAVTVSVITPLLAA